MSDQQLYEDETRASTREQPQGAVEMPGGDPSRGVAAAVEGLGDARTLLFLRDLDNGPRRFTALQESTGISPASSPIACIK